MNNKNRKENVMITLEKIEKWVQVAKKGEKMVYYKGHLAKDSDGNYLLKKIVKFVNDMSSIVDDEGRKTKKPILDVVHKKISGIRFNHPEDYKNPIVYEYILQKR
jgi:hypothetical protein